MNHNYRKKPVVIQAWQITEGATPDDMPDFIDREVVVPVVGAGDAWAFIYTLEGTMTASVGDWIIRGVKGEFYSCKPDVFAQTYEKADS